MHKEKNYKDTSIIEVTAKDCSNRLFGEILLYIESILKRNNYDFTNGDERFRATYTIRPLGDLSDINATLKQISDVLFVLQSVGVFNQFEEDPEVHIRYYEYDATIL